jgi:predicted lipoprotein with Yx(FWY)xxD motif
MRRTIGLALGIAIPLFLSGAALALDAPKTVQTTDTSIGIVLADSEGMTLYIFDEDPNGGSSCYGKCAENWPPLKASTESPPIGNFSVIARDDGVMQWTYKGKPLYRWTRDKAPGDTTGDGVRGWQAARP